MTALRRTLPAELTGPARAIVEDAQIARYQLAAQSEPTRRSYASGIAHFLAWGGSIPAESDTVVRYLVAHAETLAVATLAHRLVAIHRAHLDKGLVSPVVSRHVKQTMQGIRRTRGTAQRQVRAIVKDELLEMLALVQQQMPLKAARDEALLLVGFAGAFRRSEIVSLRCEDLTEHPEGLEILLRRSKTDQEGKGRTVFIPNAQGHRCPVKALARWRKLARITEGWLFRPVNRHDRVVGNQPLTPQSVALIVKLAVGRARGAAAAESVAGHSLRSGFVTQAAQTGLQPHQIREVTGHRSDIVLARYIRPVAKRKLPSLL